MTGDTSAEARDGGMAAGRDQTISYAPSPELLEAIRALASGPFEKLNQEQRAHIQDLQDKLGTSEGILHRVAAILSAHL